MQQIRNATSFPMPILGMNTDTNEPVRILQSGDVEGNSPSYLCVDAQGRSSWQSFSKVQIIDQQFLPPSRDHLASAARALLQPVASR